MVPTPKGASSDRKKRLEVVMEYEFHQKSAACTLLELVDSSLGSYI